MAALASQGAGIMSLPNDAGASSEDWRNARFIELRTEANRCRSFAACVIYEGTRARLRDRAAECDRQVRQLKAEMRDSAATVPEEEATEELA